MPYVTLAVAAIGAISAYDKQRKAEKGIQKLKQWKPKYRSAEEIQREAEAQITTGFTPEETASFRQSLARRGTQAYRTATQMNPNLASAVQAGINYGNIGALTDFAARDAQLRRQRIQDYIGRVTSQSNAQTNADITSKRMQEQAYGLAKQQANANIYNSLTMAAYGASRLGSSGTQTGTTTPPTTSETTTPPLVNKQTAVGSDYWAQSLYRTPDQPFYGVANTPAPMSPIQLSNPYVANYQTGTEENQSIPKDYTQSMWMTNPNYYNPYISK